MKGYLLVFLVVMHALSAGDPSSPLAARRRANSQPKSGPNSPLTERAKSEARIAALEAAQREHTQQLAALAELLHGGRHEVKESKLVPGKLVHQRRPKKSNNPWEICLPYSHDPSYEYRIIPATEEVTTVVTYPPVRQQLRDQDARIGVLERAARRQRAEQDPDRSGSLLPPIHNPKQAHKNAQKRWQNAACAALQPVQGQGVSLIQRGPGPA